MEHWLIAGQALAGRSAEREAINLFRRGLAALLTLPESPERDRRELELDMALESTAGRRESVLAQTVVGSVRQRVLELSERLGDTHGAG